VRPWHSLLDLEHRLRQLAPDDQLLARLAWRWVKGHALLTAIVLLASALVSLGSLEAVAMNVGVLSAVGVFRGRQRATTLRTAQVQGLVTGHPQSLLAYALVVAPLVAGFIALFGPLRTPAVLMILLYVNAHGLERAGTALRHYLGKQPPRARRRLRDHVRLPLTWAAGRTAGVGWPVTRVHAVEAVRQRVERWPGPPTTGVSTGARVVRGERLGAVRRSFGASIMILLVACSPRETARSEGVVQISHLFNTDVRHLTCSVTTRAHICAVKSPGKLTINTTYAQERGYTIRSAEIREDSTLAINDCHMKFGSSPARVTSIFQINTEGPPILINSDEHKACVFAKTLPGSRIMQ